ncbi:MAG: hypothetical protein KGJ93_02915 [Patescibacteria group bacterium]|nr:hypothetical protein [Patescibacteria group bacterium]
MAPGADDYNFKIYNDDTGEEIPNGVGQLPADFQLNNSIGMKFYHSWGDYGYPSYSEVSVFTGAVPVLNPNFAKNTPVLIVPGILGNNLVQDNNKLWLDWPRNLLDNGDEFMDPLQFNTSLNPLNGNVVVGDIIKKETFSTGLGKVLLFDYTDGLISEFQNQGYQENKDLFTFPYDWRYGASDNVTAQLKQKIQDILTQTGSSKINVIAHSTGGLLVKKYVASNPIDHYIDKAVFVGVPNLGAPKAVKVLLAGDNFGVVGLADSEMKKIAQNLPVSYQLAPSRAYVDQVGDFMRVVDPRAAGPAQWGSDVGFDMAMSDLSAQHLINIQGVAAAEGLHTAGFDNYDMRPAGVDVYNIVGCKSSTLGKITETVSIDGSSYYDFRQPVNGDGTVPANSAGSLAVNDEHVFFAPKANHGKMLSANGIRQEIVNIVAGKDLSTGGKILTRGQLVQNPQLCALNGELVKIKSPVNISATDQNGNYIGLAEDGSVQNDIPGADLEIWGEHKYVFLPTEDGQQYQIDLRGVDGGTFTLDDQTIAGNDVLKTQVFSNLPVTPMLSGRLMLNPAGAVLELDNNGDGQYEESVQPAAVLNAGQSEDSLAPVSTSTVFGLVGQSNFYRSDVGVALVAEDVVVPDLGSQTSGVLAIHYNLDGAGFHDYSGQLTVSAEGAHSLQFYATDRAGNNEQPQVFNFTIDKTAPELSVKFNPQTNDLSFSGLDDFSQVTVNDGDNLIQAVDQAGNVTELKLKEHGRKRRLQADLAGLSYNGAPADVSKAALSFAWGKKLLEQHVRSRKNFKIDAYYANGKTVIRGRDQTGKISQTITGLTLLTVATNKGDIVWSY